jgi:DNA-binding LacI/PurR family transcriptional regulator
LWEKGYGRAWAEFSVQFCDKGLGGNLINYQNRNAANRYNAIKQFVQSKPVHKGRTAFVLDGGDGSSGVYSALSEAGLVVGSDVAVAAMNTVPANEFVFPQLTTLVEPYEVIADTLVSELLSEIQPELDYPVSQRVYEPELVAGVSTARSKCA